MLTQRDAFFDDSCKEEDGPRWFYNLMLSDCNNMERIEDSPFLMKIKHKLQELNGDACSIIISITPQAEYFAAGNGDRTYVKWLSWQLYDNDSSLLYQSELCVVHGEMKESSLLKDLGKFFPQHSSVVDNEIYFEN